MMLKNIRDRECCLLEKSFLDIIAQVSHTSRIRRGHVWSTKSETVGVEISNKAKKKKPRFQAAVTIVVACGSLSSVSDPLSALSTARSRS
jgi:hypothetical protein